MNERLAEQTYLIYKGVRPVALVATSEGPFLATTCKELKTEADRDGIIFECVPTTDLSGNIEYALYAKHQWLIELYRLATELDDASEHALRGLLHGYSVDEIERFLATP